MTMGGGVFFLSASLSSSFGSRGSGSLTTRTSRLPSGAHAYSEIPPLTSLTFIASPPARFISHSWPPFAPWRDDTNERYLLSGLHRGCDSLSGDEVSWISCVPSQLAIHTSESFLSVSLIARDTTYATHLPSGDRCGSQTSSGASGRFWANAGDTDSPRDSTAIRGEYFIATPVSYAITLRTASHQDSLRSPRVYARDTEPVA